MTAKHLIQGVILLAVLFTLSLVAGAQGTNPIVVAYGGSYTTQAGQLLSISAPGILANDTDANGLQLTATLVSTTPDGTLQLNADGSFTYTPSKGFFGTDSFTYTATDGQDTSAQATVILTVDSVPLASAQNTGRFQGKA